MLGMLMGAMFDRAFRKFTEAFEKRADAVYGHRGRGEPHAVSASARSRRLSASSTAWPRTVARPRSPYRRSR